MLYASFIQISPSVPPVISVIDFLEGMHCRLHGKAYEYTYLQPAPTENLITANFRTSLESEEVKTFLIYDPSTLLMQDDTFTPCQWEECEDGAIKMFKAENSSHTVTRYEWNGHKLYFKHWPEAPAIEFVAHHLYKAIFPSQEHPPLPASATILLNGQMFLVLQSMEGESLHRIARKIERTPDLSRQYKFNLAKYQRIAIYCYLAFPEDCRPHNCIIRITESEEYEIILIDNERSFGHLASAGYSHETLGTISTRTHCVVFCFHKLLSMPLEADVFEELISDQSARHMTLFISKLRVGDKYIKTLNTMVAEKHIEKATMHHPGLEAVGSIFSRHAALKDIARQNRTSTLAQLFTRVLPTLAGIYEFNTLPTPEELKSDNQLSPALKLVRKIDARRFSGVTPPSAYVLLLIYFHQPDLSSLNSSRSSAVSSPGISPTYPVEVCETFAKGYYSLPRSPFAHLSLPPGKLIVQPSPSKLIDAAELSAAGLVA